MTYDRLQIRRGTASQWTSVNPTLLSGELGVETDTGKLKVGDMEVSSTSFTLGASFTVTSFTLTEGNA